MTDPDREAVEAATQAVYEQREDAAENCAIAIDQAVADVNADNTCLSALVEELEAALAWLADIHHRTMTGSKLHDPEHKSFRDCPCGTCRAARSALSPDSENTK